MFPVWFRSLSRRRLLDKLLQEAGEAQSLRLEDIPTMIWYSEQQFLYLLAREYFRGVGVIVDAGCFFGSSTRCFTAGLRDRPDLNRLLKNGQAVHSYDLGLCDDYGAALINMYYGTSYKGGDSCLDFIERMMHAYQIGDCVKFFPGDIRDQTIDAPIEVLFLDVCKTSTVNDHIVKEFFPRLIPRHSIVIQQDYLHEWLPWLHVTMGLFKPYFQFLGIVPGSPSAVWLNTRRIPDPTPWEREGRSNLYWTADLPRLLELFERGIEPLASEHQRYLVELAKSRMLAERGNKPAALRLLDRLDLRFDQLGTTPWTYPRPASLRTFVEERVF
jgi:hypothetical protein